MNDAENRGGLAVKSGAGIGQVLVIVGLLLLYGVGAYWMCAERIFGDAEGGGKKAPPWWLKIGLPTVAGADLRWSIAPSVSYRRWKLAGRSVFFVDALDLVLDDRDESSFDLTGRAAITLRTGRISVTGGVGSLVATEREFVTFLQLGWMATRIEG